MDLEREGARRTAELEAANEALRDEIAERRRVEEALGQSETRFRNTFEQAAVGKDTATSEVIANPHNQTLNVAIQWGALGVILLYAMWIAHLQLFRGEGLASWIGFVVVIQNMLSSVLNSHLFDFTEGWIYVLGVGIAGGMALAGKVSPPAAGPAGSASA